MLLSVEMEKLFDRRNVGDIISLAGGLGMSAVQKAIENSTNGTGLNVDSITYGLIFHGGDFGDAAAVVGVTDMALYYMIPRLSEPKRLGAAALMGTTAVGVAETVPLPHSVLGKPDIADIPAGIMGVSVGAALASTVFFRRVRQLFKPQDA